MLQMIRDRATGWIAWFIIILICVPFALWGIQEYVSPQGSLAVAEVNDAEIGYYRFQDTYQRQRRQLAQMLRQPGLAATMESQIRTQALEGLINEEVLTQSARNSGLRVSDRQLVDAIRQLPSFQGESGFSQEVYENFLRSRGMSPQGFEEEMRRSILMEQLTSAVRGVEFVTRQEAERFWRSESEQRHYRELRIDPLKLEAPEPEEAAIEAYFKANSEKYMRPEHVKVAYIELSREEIGQNMAINEQDIKAIYDASQANYKTEESREARHILVQVPRDADEATVEAAKNKIDAIRSRILEGGEDFVDVAKDSSDDPGSASNGGSLGYFGRGVMDPAFEDASFSLDKGQLSEPVRSSFGWHLIEVTGIQAERIRTFEEAREDVTAALRTAEAEQLYAERVEELANLAFEHPESLEVVAEALSVTPVVTEYFSRSGEAASGVTANARFRAAAFSTQVLEDSANSELIELAPGRVAVLRVLERQAERALSLDEAVDQVRQTIMKEVREARAVELGEAIVAALEAGGSLDEVATAHDQKFSEIASVTPAAPGKLDDETKRALFALEAPESEDRPRIKGLPQPAGSFRILALTKVEVPQGPATEDQIKDASEKLASTMGATSNSVLMRSFRDRAEVRIFQENLSSDSL